MSQGKIVAQGSGEELSAGEELNLTLLTSDTELAVQGLKTHGINGVIDGNSVRALIPAGQLAPEKLIKTLVDSGVGVKGFTLLAPTLEERFVLLTGEGFDVER